MPIKLITQAVGPWPMNTYIVIDEEKSNSTIVDPGADPDTILTLVEGTNIEAILITHGHPDHIGANRGLQEATGASILVHHADAARLTVKDNR